MSSFLWWQDLELLLQGFRCLSGGQEMLTKGFRSANDDTMPTENGTLQSPDNGIVPLGSFVTSTASDSTDGGDVPKRDAVLGEVRRRKRRCEKPIAVLELVVLFTCVVIELLVGVFLTAVALHGLLY